MAESSREPPEEVASPSGNGPRDRPDRVRLIRRTGTHSGDGIRVELTVDTGTRSVNFSITPNTEKGLRDFIDSIQPVARSMGLEIVLHASSGPAGIKGPTTKIV